MLNEILGVGARFQQALTRKFGILGGAPSPQLTPEITPQYNLPTGEEDLILSSVYLAMGYKATVGAAGQLATNQLNNPAGSNIAIVVEGVGVTHAGGGEVIGGVVRNGPLPALVSPGWTVLRDTRVSTNGGSYTRVPVGVITGDTNTPALSVEQNYFRVNLAANERFDFRVPVILAPGWCVQIQAVSAAATIRTWFYWREVPLAGGESGPF